MMKLIRDLFTGVDGSTWDLGRVLWAGGAAVLIAGGILAMVKGPLDFVAFAGAFGGLLMAGGGALLFKAKTEPQKITATQVTATGTTSQTVEAGAAKTDAGTQ